MIDDSPLLNEFRLFLGGLKTSESITDDLRQAITVSSPLVDAIVSAISAGRDVVVAGSAGGGKTHAIEVARTRLGLEFVSWPAAEPTDRGYVRYVPDTTAIGERREQPLADRPSNCLAVVVAINEGPLLDLARRYQASPYARARDLLHQAQLGETATDDDASPTVIDIGGFDLLRARVLESIVGLPLLTTVAQTVRCQCEAPEVCPRQLAWAQLDTPEIRGRISDLLVAAHPEGQSLLFRELWDFVSDIATGGDCQASPPTSPWFWRVFYGDSAISLHLRSTVTPQGCVFPRLETHLYYGDWSAMDAVLQQQVSLVPAFGSLPLSPPDLEWMKAQILFVMRNGSVADLVREQLDLRLAPLLDDSQSSVAVPALVSAINSYMTYSSIAPSQQFLQLWVDLGVERREERPSGQVAVGGVAATDLRVAPSYAAANHPDPELRLPGARRYLVHAPTGARLLLTPESLNLLLTGRSSRTASRPHVDLDWHLTRFFYAIASANDSSAQLDVMRIDFSTMRASFQSYRVSSEMGKIEPLLEPRWQ